MTSETLASPYRVRAFNTAAASENKIHDDTMAKRFGFAAGLVPGVEVYAYMTHLAVERWGRDWLERGDAECRFLSPVYDGQEVEVSAAEKDSAMTVKLTSAGVLCASGAFALAAPPQAARQWRAAPPPPAPADRPGADERSLAPGILLGVRPLLVSAEFAAQYLADVRETHPLYAQENLAHPGIVLRLCNQALVQNVTLGPWIHVGSTVRNRGSTRIGDTLSLSAEVAGNYENKGHKFVDLDILVSAAERPVAEVMHRAIYRPRQVAEGG